MVLHCLLAQHKHKKGPNEIKKTQSAKSGASNLFQINQSRFFSNTPKYPPITPLNAFGFLIGFLLGCVLGYILFF